MLSHLFERIEKRETQCPLIVQIKLSKTLKKKRNSMSFDRPN